VPIKQTFLDFEQPIAELQTKIDELRFVHEDSAVDIADEIARLSKKSQQLTKDIYSKLTAWQIAQVARHPQRPYTLDYVAGCSPSSASCTATAATRTTRRSSAGSRASTAGPASSSATRRAATPRRRSTATSACRAPRATARRCG
jgi:hypothetical protein